MDMLDKAFAKTPDNTQLIFHSDQGRQYQPRAYQKRLKDKGIRQSMSRKEIVFSGRISNGMGEMYRLL